jgi:hypothetical protein
MLTYAVPDGQLSELRRAVEGCGLKCLTRLSNLHTSAYVSIRQHTSAYVSIRQHTPDTSHEPARVRRGAPLRAHPRTHTSAYVCIRQHTSYVADEPARVRRAAPLRAPAPQRMPAYVSIRQHTSAYVSIRQHRAPPRAPAPQHSPAYVSIRQHTSAYVSIRQHASACVSIERERERLLRSTRRHGAVAKLFIFFIFYFFIFFISAAPQHLPARSRCRTCGRERARGGAGCQARLRGYQM